MVHPNIVIEVPGVVSLEQVERVYLDEDPWAGGRRPQHLGFIEAVEEHSIVMLSFGDRSKLVFD